MKVVVDTNVVISGIFFGGNPRRIVEEIVDGNMDAYATTEIVDEYMGIIDSMIERKQGRLNQGFFSPLFSSLKIIESESEIDVCRDSDDNTVMEGARADSKGKVGYDDQIVSLVTCSSDNYRYVVSAVKVDHTDEVYFG